MDLFIAIIASTIGVGYFIYGKKTSALHFIIVGIVLMFYPYFFHGAMLIIVGIILLAAPFIIINYYGID